MQYILDNMTFVLILFGLFTVDYIVERLRSKGAKEERPSFIWVPMYTLGTILATELTYYLIRLLWEDINTLPH